MPAGDPVNDADPAPGSRKSLRIAGFANFFKSYMSVSAIIAASIPIPVAALKLIPTYEQQRGYLSVYASLFCFLLVAFVFSIRHALAVRMFSRGAQSALIAALPAVFILLTAVSIADYHLTLQHSLAQWRSVGVTAPSSELLSKADYMEIPHSLRLTLCYLGIFVFAEAAFVLMAMREYLQDILHLDELKLAQGRKAAAHAAVSPSASSPPASSSIAQRAKSPAQRRGG